jgi:YHS domain-containing protein
VAGMVAIHGFCPVCVLDGEKVKGKDEFTTEYKGKVYEFADFNAQKKFINDPEKYVANLDAKFNALKDGGMMKKEGGMMEEGSH